MDSRLEASWRRINGNGPDGERMATPPLTGDSSVHSFTSGGDAMRWGKLRTISSHIYGSTSRFGKPSCILCTREYIIIGTESAQVLLFDYSQQLVATLAPPAVQGIRHGSVTAMALSPNEKYLAVGFSQGFVCAWDLSKPQSPSLYAAPITRVPDESSKFQDNESHLLGTPILFVFFNGSGSHSSIVSADNRGMLFQHENVLLLMRRQVKSRKLAGHYIPKTPTTLFACKKIQINGGSKEPTLIVSLTPVALSIYSLYNQHTSDTYRRGMLFRYPRMLEDIDVSTGLSGTLSWYAPSKKLAYSWGDRVGIMNVDWSAGREKTLICAADRALKCPETVVFLDWLNPNLLVAVTVTKRVLFIGLDSMAILDTTDITTKAPIHHDYFSQVLRDGKDAVVSDAFFNSLQVQSASLFILGRYELVYGALTNWADRIMTFLNQSKPTDAVRLAIQFYQDSTDLSMLGLEDHNRGSAIEHTLPDIIITSVRFSLEHDGDEMPDLLMATLQAIFITKIPLLEPVFELVEGTHFEGLFIDQMIPFILEGYTNSLPPSIFHVLVKHKEGSPELQDIIFCLDSSTLDMDLAFTVARRQKFVDLEIFLLSQALHEYVEPLLLEGDSTRKYIYLSYTLSGRMYPSGEHMLLDEAEKAKYQVYEEVFMGKTQTALVSLLSDDAAAFFMALNEAFEDAYLNDDDDDRNAPINRQIIVNILIDALRINSDLGANAKIQFDIFLARNIPKYPQYLFVPGNFLEKVVHDLCDVNSSLAGSDPKLLEEIQLALMSLLSVFKPQDLKATLEVLHEAKYFIVMEQIYQSSGNYKKLVSTTLEDIKSDRLWNVLARSLRADEANSLPSVVEHFKALAERDTKQLAHLVVHVQLSSLYNELNQLDESLQTQFLDDAYSEIANSGGRLPPQAVSERYVRLLAKDSGDKLMTILNSVLTGKEDVKLDNVLESLEQYKRTDSLVLLLSRLGRSDEAIVYVTNHILDGVKNDAEAQKFAELGTTICVQVTGQDVNAGEELWKKLLDALVSSGNSVNHTLQALVETGVLSSRLAMRVVSGLIKDEPAKYTGSLSTVMFTAIRQQQFLLKAIKEIVEHDMYSEIVKVMEVRLRGWAVSIDGECEACGHKVVGVGIDGNKVYDEWEKQSRERAKVDLFHVEPRQEPLQPDADVLVVFSCAHTYHRACLLRLGDGMECIAHSHTTL